MSTRDRREIVRGDPSEALYFSMGKSDDTELKAGRYLAGDQGLVGRGCCGAAADRKSVVEGKSVDRGGRRTLTKKTRSRCPSS